MAIFDFLTAPLLADDRALGLDVKRHAPDLQRAPPLDPLEPLWDVLRSTDPTKQTGSSTSSHTRALDGER
jgi:hypothetical protein